MKNRSCKRVANKFLFPTNSFIANARWINRPTRVDTCCYNGEAKTFFKFISSKRIPEVLFKELPFAHPSLEAALSAVGIGIKPSPGFSWKNFQEGLEGKAFMCNLKNLRNIFLGCCEAQRMTSASLKWECFYCDSSNFLGSTSSDFRFCNPFLINSQIVTKRHLNHDLNFFHILDSTSRRMFTQISD